MEALRPPAMDPQPSLIQEIESTTRKARLYGVKEEGTYPREKLRISPRTHFG